MTMLWFALAGVVLAVVLYIAVDKNDKGAKGI